MKVYAGGSLIPRGIAYKFFVKKPRAGLTEAVNALLHIPYAKVIVKISLRPSGYRSKYCLLQVVAVLILVYHNGDKAGGKLPGGLGTVTLIINQYFKGIMLNVGKIKY